MALCRISVCNGTFHVGPNLTRD